MVGSSVTGTTVVGEAAAVDVLPERGSTPKVVVEPGATGVVVVSEATGEVPADAVGTSEKETSWETTVELGAVLVLSTGSAEETSVGRMEASDVA